MDGKGGDYLGATDRFFLMSAGDGATAYRFDQPEAHTPSAALKGDRPNALYGYRNTQTHTGKVCLFATGNATNDEVIVFDDASKQTVRISPVTPLERHSSWVALDGYALRFGDQKRHPDIALHSRTPWLELYDFHGNRVVTSAPLPETKADPYSVFFVGTTRKGRVLFEYGDHLLVVAIPSLKVVADSDLGEAPYFPGAKHGYRQLFMNRGSRCIYEAAGGAYAEKFPTDSIPHEIHINDIDPETGQRTRSYTETVTVRKLKSE